MRIADRRSMNNLALLRKLVEQQQFQALREVCLADVIDHPSIKILLALAHAHLGDLESAKELLSELLPKQDSFDIDTRVDLAAVILLSQGPDQAGALRGRPGADRILAPSATHARRAGSARDLRAVRRRAARTGPDVARVSFRRHACDDRLEGGPAHARHRESGSVLAPLPDAPGITASRARPSDAHPVSREHRERALP